MEQQYIPATQVGAIATPQNKVLRNTYMMLALTMIPTVIGAFLGTSTNFSFMALHPIMFSLMMFGAMMGLMFGVTAMRNSVWGVVLLLAFTFVAGFFLGPILQMALHLKTAHNWWVWRRAGPESSSSAWRLWLPSANVISASWANSCSSA